MRFLILSLTILISSLLLSSCLTLEETLTLQADGSGTMVVNMDMSEMLANPLMQMAMAEEMEKEGKEMPERIDSALNIIDEMIPMNPQWTTEDKSLLSKITSRMIMDFEQGEGGVVVTMPFDNLDQLMRMQKLMSEAKEPEDEEGGEDNPFSSLTSGGSNVINTFAWKKGKFSREATMGENLFGDMGADSEDMGMVKMMFSDAKMIFKTVFPGDIKKVKGYPGHTIEGGNTLVQEFSFLDLLDEPNKIDEGLDGLVKYKK